MIDFVDVIKSWWIAENPTEQESILAKKRLEICLNCPSYKQLFKKKKWSAMCDGCGCPISKKIFSQTINPCPLDKWIEIDKRYGNGMDKKEQKSII
jgi:hypothetical protein